MRRLCVKYVTLPSLSCLNLCKICIKYPKFFFAVSAYLIFPKIDNSILKDVILGFLIFLPASICLHIRWLWDSILDNISNINILKGRLNLNFPIFKIILPLNFNSEQSTNSVLEPILLKWLKNWCCFAPVSPSACLLKQLYWATAREKHLNVAGSCYSKSRKELLFLRYNFVCSVASFEVLFIALEWEFSIAPSATAVNKTAARTELLLGGLQMAIPIDRHYMELLRTSIFLFYLKVREFSD